MPHRIHLEQFGNVHALPVLHYRMEFAHLVRQAVRMVRPDCIAIELPSTLERPFLRGVNRLPEISVLSYEVSSASMLKVRTAEDTPQTAYLLIEPADPLVEAARLALQQELPLHLIDLDLQGKRVSPLKGKTVVGKRAKFSFQDQNRKYPGDITVWMPGSGATGS